MADHPSSDNTPVDNAIPDPIEPSQQSTLMATPEPGFGWNHYAEQINGRFAMVGFIALLLMELFTRQDFFTWIGLR